MLSVVLPSRVFWENQLPPQCPQQHHCHTGEGQGTGAARTRPGLSCHRWQDAQRPVDWLE